MTKLYVNDHLVTDYVKTTLKTSSRLSPEIIWNETLWYLPDISMECYICGVLSFYMGLRFYQKIQDTGLHLKHDICIERPSCFSLLHSYTLHILSHTTIPTHSSNTDCYKHPYHYVVSKPETHFEETAVFTVSLMQSGSSFSQ